MNRIRNIVAPSLVQSAIGFLCEGGSSPAHDRWTRVVLNVDSQSELKLAAVRSGLFRTETQISAGLQTSPCTIGHNEGGA